MKNLKFFCIVIMVVMVQVSAFSQGVSINSDGTPPDNSAMLDIKSPTTGQMGVLFPRVNLVTGISTPATHLFGVNTDASFGVGMNSGLGLYRYTGSQWNRLLEAPDANSFWNINGNTGTNPANHFIGTTDNTNFIIRTASNYTGGGVTPASGTKVTVPWRPNERIIFSNVRGLELPAGSDAAPSLVFVNGNLGMYGLSGGGNSGIALRSATSLYSFFTQNGLRITTSGANLLAESSMLDVEGNIFIRKGKLIYTEFGSVPSFLNPEKTFKNEIHWDGTIPASNDSPTFWDENGDFRLRVRRNASGEYFLRIATTTVKNFTCVNNLGEVTIVTTTANITTFHPVNFTTQITGPNGAQTITMREQANPAATYQIIVIVADGNVGVSLQRWQN